MEYNNLLNQVEGAASFGVQGAALGTTFHSFNVDMARTRMQSVANGDDNNIVTVQCGVTPLQPTDGVTPIIAMTATTSKDEILGL